MRRTGRVATVFAIVAALLPLLANTADAAVGDTPPTWPNGAAITVSSIADISATLDWPAAFDDVSVAGYRIYSGGGALLGTSADTTHTLTGLTPDSGYTVRIEAYDGDGNESVQLSGLNYGPRLSLYAGNEPHSIDTADLNHDGDIDLAIAARGDDSAAILLGNGDGTFGGVSLYAVGTSGDGVGPKNLAFGYFNSDGHLDIVSANQDDGTAGVILGNGDGSFGSVTPYATSYGTHDVAVGDFDNDNDTDFLTIGWGDDDGTLWLGDGDGTFSDATAHYGGSSPHGIVAADFDNNGDLDFATGANGDSGAVVRAGNGNATFQSAVVYEGTTGGWAHDIAMGDFNNDGDEDLVIAGEQTDDLSVFLGGSGVSFSSGTAYGVAGEPKGVAVGDLNDDGNDDLIATSVVGHYPSCPSGSGDPLTFWFGNGSGGFSAGGSVTVGVAPFDAAVADFNGDGWNDLAAPAWCDDNVSVFLNLGEGGPTATFQTLAGGGDPTEPDAPAPPTATAGDEAGAVNWAAPYDGGSAILNYDLYVENLTTTGTATIDVGNNLSHNLTGLTNGDTYRVRVRASNAIGDGAWSNWSANFVPGTVPSAPGTPAVSGGDAELTATWTAPVDNGGSAIASYELQLNNQTAGTTDTSNVGDTLSEDVTGLNNGDSYRARVRAINATGSGPWSSWSSTVIPQTVPDAPSQPGATAGDAQLTATWSTPFNGGSAITSYDLRTRNLTEGSSSDTNVGLVLSELVSGLDNGDEYEVRVRANNANGPGGWSAWSVTVVPGSAPSAPGAPLLVAGDGDLNASWSAPADNGGSAITSYELHIDDLTTGDDSIADVGLTLSENVGGLTNGDDYRVRVRAINAVGTGPWSVWSNTVTPQTVPDSPDAPLVAAGEATVTVDWLQPFDGGATINGYELELEDESDGSSTIVDPGLDLTESFTGLANGHSYRARVRAENANGWSSWSAWSDGAVPGSTPGAPGTPSLVGGTGDADAAWTAPTDDGGSAIVGYELEVENVTTGVSAYLELADVTSATVLDLINGSTYRVRVRAINADGRGAWSAWSPNAIPATVPDAPGSPTATAGDTEVTATWNPPGDDGGDAVTGYQLEVEDVVASAGVITDVGPVLAVTVDGLTNGNAHRVRVRAGNSKGWGVWSQWSSTVTPEGDTFTDDNGSVFEDDIEWLAKSGITKGCNPPTNDQFCPNDPVTRGQMAAFVVRALDLSDPGSIDFVDDDHSIFETDIAKLAAAGITKGCNPPTNDRFCPEDNVTRGQMAAFMVRALGLTARGNADFVDDDGSIFEADIERLAAAGITKGCNPPANDRYCPDDPVTRGQMAAFLRRALG